MRIHEICVTNKDRKKHDESLASLSHRIEIGTPTDTEFRTCASLWAVDQPTAETGTETSPLDFFLLLAD